MAWGGGNANSVEAWVKRLRDNDSSFTSLHILSFRRITSSELGQVFEALTSNTTLKEFYASGHSFDETAAKTLAVALEKNSTLERLNIGNDHLGGNEGVVKVLSDGLSKNKGLIRLDLENKGFGGRNETSVKYISEALEKNGALQELVLARNKLTDQDIEVLCKSLGQGRNKALQKLDLCLNSFGEPGTRSIANLLASQNQIDGSAGALNEIDLSDNEITGEGGQAIGRALETNKMLQKLRMSSCMDPPLPLDEGAEDKIQWDDDVQLLNKSLTPEQEQEIHMDGDTVLETIASSLKVNQTLQELWMDYCNISSIGATFLASALRHNQGLITVRMRNNRIGNRGARALGAALSPSASDQSSAFNTSLKNLELGSNMLGVLGWHGLVGASSLESLGLYENQICTLHEALENHSAASPITPVSSTTIASVPATPTSSTQSSDIPNGSTSTSHQVLEKLMHLDVGCNGISRENYTQLGVCLIKGQLPSLIRLEIAGNGDRSQAPQLPGDEDEDDNDSEPNPQDPNDEQSAWQRVTSSIEEARPNLAIHWKGAGAMQQA
ncbi:T-complex-associated testis-expressed protein 1 [Entomortierella lignicola]|nr:T-complex-associated testis-expressed protein 1 [Entomortierella lignicola]